MQNLSYYNFAFEKLWMKRGLVLDEKKFYVELAHIFYQKHFFFFLKILSKSLWSLLSQLTALKEMFATKKINEKIDWKKSEWMVPTLNNPITQMKNFLIKRKWLKWRIFLSLRSTVLVNKFNAFLVKWNGKVVSKKHTLRS